jgi:hypothetical protein
MGNIGFCEASIYGSACTLVSSVSIWVAFLLYIGDKISKRKRANERCGMFISKVATQRSLFILRGGFGAEAGNEPPVKRRFGKALWTFWTSIKQCTE